MHPLDTFGYEGFAMVASRRFVVRRPLPVVWRVLVVEDDDGCLDAAGAGMVRHTVVERFGPGEHRCTVVGSVDGRDCCSRGFRRVLAGAEVLQVQCRPGEDVLLRTSFRACRFGRTEVALDAGSRRPVRTITRSPAAAESPGRWDERLRQVERRARSRMRSRTRQAQ